MRRIPAPASKDGAGSALGSASHLLVQLQRTVLFDALDDRHRDGWRKKLFDHAQGQIIDVIEMVIERIAVAVGMLRQRRDRDPLFGSACDLDICIDETLAGIRACMIFSRSSQNSPSFRRSSPY